MLEAADGGPRFAKNKFTKNILYAVLNIIKCYNYK